jgi:hypothetical protein
MKLPEPGFYIFFEISIGNIHNSLINRMLFQIYLIVFFAGWAGNHFYKRFHYTNKSSALIALILGKWRRANTFCQTMKNTPKNGTPLACVRIYFRW